MPGKSRIGARPLDSPLESGAQAWLGTALSVLLAFGILTLWVRGQWAVSAVQVGIYLLTALWLAGVLFGGFQVRRHALLIPVAGATVWGCLQLALGTSIYRWATEVAVLDWFTRFTVLFLALQVFANRQMRDRFLRWALWFGFALSVVAILQRFTSPDRVFWLFDVEPGGITMGPFVYHNQYAAFVEMLVPLALLGAVEEKKDRWLYLVMAGAMVASVVASVSRAGTALVLAESLLVLAILSRRQRIPRRSLIGAAAGVAILTLVFAASVGWEPLQKKFDREDQLAERSDLYLATIEMAREKPAIGFGLGTWSTAYPAFATFDDGKFDNQAHNDWLQWTAEGGLPLLALMLLMAGLLLRPALKTVWGVGLLAVLLHVLVDYHFQQRPVFAYYWFALAGLLAACVAGRAPVERPSR